MRVFKTDVYLSPPLQHILDLTQLRAFQLALCRLHAARPTKRRHLTDADCTGRAFWPALAVREKLAVLADSAQKTVRGARVAIQCHAGLHRRAPPVKVPAAACYRGGSRTAGDAFAVEQVFLVVANGAL